MEETFETTSKKEPKLMQLGPPVACKPVQQGTGKHIYSDACDLQTQESKPASKQASQVSKPASNHASKQKKHKSKQASKYVCK